MSTTLELGNGDASNTTAFRDLVTKVDTNIQGFGWVHTSDTGQLDPTTVTAPGSISTNAGYRVYSTGDGLTTWYLKLTFRRDGSNRFAIIPLLGTATDGAGTLSGQLSATLTEVGANSLPNTSSSCQLAMSGTTSRLTIVCGLISGSNQASWGFAVGRTVDNAGANSDDGMELFAKGSAVVGGNKFIQQYVPKTGTVPTYEANWRAIMSFNASTLIGSNIRPGFPITWGETTTNNPQVLVAVVGSSDYSFGTANTTTFTLYSASRTYLLDGDAMNSAPVGFSNAKCAWRYE